MRNQFFCKNIHDQFYLESLVQWESALSAVRLVILKISLPLNGTFSERACPRRLLVLLGCIVIKYICLSILFCHKVAQLVQASESYGVCLPAIAAMYQLELLDEARILTVMFSS